MILVGSPDDSSSSRCFLRRPSALGVLQDLIRFGLTSYGVTIIFGRFLDQLSNDSLQEIAYGSSRRQG
jgi:hypothetical protein